jgi:hypothetical protein
MAFSQPSRKNNRATSAITELILKEITEII